MDRYTKQDCVNAAKRLANVLGKEFGNCWVKVGDKWKSKVGCWDVSTYGGVCIIEEISNESGEVYLPFGYTSRRPRDFVDAVNFAIKAIDIYMKRR